MKRMKLVPILLTWLAISSLASSSQAASFDCAKARSKVEKLICTDGNLSRLDEELAAAYKVALRDERQALSIRQAQKQWLIERSGCADMECLKTSYQLRLQRLSDFAGVSDQSQANKPPSTAWDYVLHKGQAGTEDWREDADDAMCQKIKSYMNRVAPDWVREGPATLKNYCTPAVRLAPFFSEPPWEELDPRRHEDLIVRLLRFRHDPVGYFKPERLKPGFDDNYFRTQARDFIETGGRLQHWKARLKEFFYFPADGNDKPAPSGDQHIVQLRYVVDYARDERFKQQACSLPNWRGAVFLVTQDLTGPIRVLDTRMTSSSLLVYEGAPVLDDSGIDEISVHSPYDSRVRHSCRLKNSERQRTERR